MSNSTFWDVTVPRAMTIYANLIFVILWVGFIIALIVNRAWLDGLWSWVQALPQVPKVIAWVFVTPIMTTLWIWESSWSVLGRLGGFSGIVGWTLLAVSSIYKHFR
ncbi:MAG: hypothetical protein ABFS03_08585 [Chloroflexota bacterium]